MSFRCEIPATPTLQLDDDAVRVTRWDFPVGAATGWHSHGLPYIVVFLTDGVLRIHNGQTETATTLKAGQTYRRAAGIEHDVMNGSPHPIAFIEIEVKSPSHLATV